MNVGIVPSLMPEGGGVHQYTLNLLTALNRVAVERSDGGDRMTVFHDYDDLQFQEVLESEAWSTDLLHPSWKDRVKGIAKWARDRSDICRLVSDLTERRHIDRCSLDVKEPDRKPRFGRYMRERCIDWILYTSPNPLSFQAGIPYVMPVHDIHHRVNPEFPEFTAGSRWLRREYLFRNAVREAMLILVDSETSKEQILDNYRDHGLEKERVKILPFAPPSHRDREMSSSKTERIRNRYDLPERFFFLPAQFWSHKNHGRVIEAIADAERKNGTKIQLVLSGSNKGHYRRPVFQSVRMRAQALGVDDRVHYVGYVPEKDMSAIYMLAEALVLVPLVGPTYLPVLEAWETDCAVIASDVPGLAEQVGDAGRLVDPASVSQIRSSMEAVWREPSVREGLRSKGQQRLKYFSPRKFEARVAAVIKEANERISIGNTSLLEKGG